MSDALFVFSGKSIEDQYLNAWYYRLFKQRDHVISAKITVVRF